MRNVKKMVGISQEKELYGRPRRRWEDNIKMNYRNIGMKGCGGFRSTEFSAL
jgi:hypothetical protein